MKEAEKIFSNRKLWDTALTNFQIDRFAKRLKIPGWKGVFSRDEIPKKLSQKLDEKESYIVNIEPLNRGNGTHWVAVIKDGQEVYYFDSYGMVPVKEVLKRYDDLPLLANTVIMQDLHMHSIYCGMISLYILYAYWYMYDRDFKKAVMDTYNAYI